MPQNRTYDMEYKVEAVKLALEIGKTKAARELDIPANTLHTWMRQYRLGNLTLGAGTQTPQRAMTLSKEIQQLRKQVKEQNKEIKRLREENEFLEEKRNEEKNCSRNFGSHDGNCSSRLWQGDSKRRS